MTSQMYLCHQCKGQPRTKVNFVLLSLLLAEPSPIALEALSLLTAQEETVDVFSTPPQLDGNLITLTLLPRTRWQTLLNLEVIQVVFILLLLSNTHLKRVVAKKQAN